jgi:hypothetical protein
MLKFKAFCADFSIGTDAKIKFLASDKDQTSDIGLLAIIDESCEVVRVFYSRLFLATVLRRKSLSGVKTTIAVIIADTICK